jgi:hypothetical protein
MHRLPLNRLNEMYKATHDPRALALLNRLSHNEFATDQDIVLFERIELAHMEKLNNVRHLAEYRRRSAFNRSH